MKRGVDDGGVSPSRFCKLGHSVKGSAASAPLKESGYSNPITEETQTASACLRNNPPPTRITASPRLLLYIFPFPHNNKSDFPNFPATMSMIQSCKVKRMFDPHNTSTLRDVTEVNRRRTGSSASKAKLDPRDTTGNFTHE